MENNEIDYKKAAEQFRKGEPLFGKDGTLVPMLERILNAALEGEMDAHLSEDYLSAEPRCTRHNCNLADENKHIRPARFKLCNPDEQI